MRNWYIVTLFYGGGLEHETANVAIEPHTFDDGFSMNHDQCYVNLAYMLLGGTEWFHCEREIDK